MRTIYRELRPAPSHEFQQWKNSSLNLFIEIYINLYQLLSVIFYINCDPLWLKNYVMLSYVRRNFKEIVVDTRDLTFEFHVKAFASTKCRYVE